MDTKLEKVCLAKLAEQSERYEEMVKFMTEAVESDIKLSVEERTLLSVAYKNVISSRRSSWRIISSIEQKEKANQSSKWIEVIQKYRHTIEKELKELCHEIIELLDLKLITAASNAEYKVYYYKMKGDYYRYLAEFLTEDEHDSAANSSLKAYTLANDEAVQGLSPIDPVRLGLALNFSVFYYEIYESPEKACQLAQQAFDLAIAEIEDGVEDHYKDSTLILQLIRDNLALWKSDINEMKNKPEDTPTKENHDVVSPSNGIQPEN